MSNESKATLIIDGNTEQVAKKFDDTFNKAGKKGGESFENAVGKLARGVVIAKAIGDSLRAAADEFNRIKEEARKVGETADRGSVGINQTGERLGLGGSLLGLIRTASGATSEEQRASFAAGLDERNGQDINRRAIRLQAEGAFTDSEITDAIKNGTLGDLEAGRGKRRAMLGPDFERVVNLEDQRRQQEALKREATVGTELGQSAAERQKELAQLNNPATAAAAEGVLQGVGKLPVVGGIIESGGRAANDIAFRLLGAMEETARNTRGKLNMSGAQDNQ